MTERLYYTDAYLRNFSAQIVDRSEDSRTVYLDRTAFYPTSGGQPYDSGSIGGPSPGLPAASIARSVSSPSST